MTYGAENCGLTRQSTGLATAGFAVCVKPVIGNVRRRHWRAGMTETELKCQSDLADARLGVAEELWWPMAILAAIAIHMQWDNWLLTAASVIAVYFLVTHRYRRAADKAEDEYFRVAHLGKYASQSGEKNV